MGCSSILCNLLSDNNKTLRTLTHILWTIKESSDIDWNINGKTQYFMRIMKAAIIDQYSSIQLSSIERNSQSIKFFIVTDRKSVDAMYILHI